MSSKSRKKNREPHHEPRATHPGHAQAGPEAHVHHSVAEKVDELVKVPRDTSKLRFVLMIVLVVALLIIFVIPQALTSLTRPSEESVAFRWNDPDAGLVNVDYPDFVAFKRQVSDSFRFDQFMPFRVGIEDLQNATGDPETARLMILDQLSERAGVRISDADLLSHLRQLIDRSFQGDVRGFEAAMNAYGGHRNIEAGIRRCLRIARYLQLLGHFAQAPDPEKVEELWHDAHEELAYDYVSVLVADLREAAEGEVPDDAALEAWFGELEEFDRDTFKTPEKRSAEIVRWEAGTDATALLEAYPAEEELEPEQLADNYYQRVFFRRFKRPEEAQPPAEEEVDDESADAADEGAEGEDEPEAEKPAKGPYLTLEEVEEEARDEAPAYFAMERWLADLRERAGQEGAEIDLAGEAARFGLKVETVEPGSREELQERGLDLSLTTLIFQSQPEALAPRIQVDGKGFMLVRVGAIVEPALPAFAEIRDQVAERWVDDRMEELALERLRSLRDGFLVLEDDEDEAEDESADAAEEEVVRRQATEEAFEEAATAAQLEVGHRPWLDKAARPNDDPEKDDPAHVFLRARREWTSLDENEVPEPRLDGLGERAYLVRVAGRREIPIERMAIGDYETLLDRARMQAASVVRDTYTVESLRKHYGLWLSTDELDEKLPGEPQG